MCGHGGLDVEGLEVTRRNRRRDRDTPRRRPFGTSRNFKSSAAEVLQGHATTRCRDLDAWKRADAAKALLNHPGYARWIFELRTRQRHAHRQHMMHIEAWIHVPNRDEGSH